MTYLANALSASIDEDKIAVYYAEFKRRGIPGDHIKPIFVAACEADFRYFPSVEALVALQPSTPRQGIAWIPPQGGHCQKDSINGHRMEDGRETRCGCRTCRPDFASWCHWLYADGQFCANFERTGEPYCGKHFERACEHYEISTLSLKQQVQYLLDLDRNGKLLFTTDGPNPEIVTPPMPLVTSRKEFLAAVHQIAEGKSFRRTA
jgi:hypothetical protein